MAFLTVEERRGVDNFRTAIEDKFEHLMKLELKALKANKPRWAGTLRGAAASASGMIQSLARVQEMDDESAAAPE